MNFVTSIRLVSQLACEKAMDCTTSFNSDHGSFAELMSLGSNLGLSKEIYLASLLVLLSLSLYFWQGKSFQAPFVGYRSFWEPTFIVRLRFVTGAWPIIMEGYSRYKNGIFKIRRNDTDIVIVSNKYVDELRALPEEKASAIEAHIKVEILKLLAVSILLTKHT